MPTQDRREFERRFAERQQLFLSAVEGIACESSRWQIYLDHQQITADGAVEIRAVKNGDLSSDLDALHKYIKFVTGQGFHLEIVADPNRDIHVLSWEELEPDWPDDLDAVLSVRWNTVTGPL